MTEQEKAASPNTTSDQAPQTKNLEISRRGFLQAAQQQWLPRNGGRVIFRSRFADFIGEYVHHCHILLHEDNGMMHVVQTTQYIDDTNYIPKTEAASFAATEEEVNAVYPRPSLETSYLQCINFIDPNPETGQVFPSFEVAVPEYDEGA